MLPYVYQGGVEHYGWLTGPQMMDGLALGDTLLLELRSDLKAGDRLHPKGSLLAADMAAYEAKERPVLRGSYRGYDVLSMPPISSSTWLAT